MEEAENETPFGCPNTVTVRRNPPRRARPTPSAIALPESSSNQNCPKISSFPIQDILTIEIAQKPSQRQQQQPTTSSSSYKQAPVSENLKVYLRFRPPKGPIKHDQALMKGRQKNAWPQNPSKKKISARWRKSGSGGGAEACISVNDDAKSVTLSPPVSLQDLKRIKSEVFDGFSRVFAANSSQEDVYREMVSPIVEEFLEGKSGMLAALGPSGSGKTHTVFGTPREPGMVPLALRQIFQQKQTQDGCFYISIFEIYSERGKVEKICDLSAEGMELSMQQSTIKGLQEVGVSDASQAESLIACAMLKRATAMTNTNSQSSRSQCVINVHYLVKKNEVEHEAHLKDAVLTVVDLAGAEREKRTGNQGCRLLESNFINNTVMVFGLCLRSLLEHQKNPKKPLQKHYQSSLLTRYLRGYLEGKKRMTLILTVKPGEEDYLDTAHLLRQASPYMKIKFKKVEEPTNLVHNKRHLQPLSTVGQFKRMKYNGCDDHEIDEEKGIPDDNPLLMAETPRSRNHQIMQSFAKALWNVLKEYKQKLIIAEKKIQNLNENLDNEKKRSLELEKELEEYKSHYKCSKESLDAVLLHELEEELKVPTESQALLTPEKNESDKFNETPTIKEPKCCKTQEHNSMPGHDEDPSTKMNEGFKSPNLQASGFHDLENHDSALKCDLDGFPQMDVNVHSLEVNISECNGSPINKVHNASCQEQLCRPLSPQKVQFAEQCRLEMQDRETRLDDSCKPVNVEKPKRKLLPASSNLLRDMTALSIEDELDKTKVRQGEKKVIADERQRTRGSISLLRFLQSNLHL